MDIELRLFFCPNPIIYIQNHPNKSNKKSMNTSHYHFSTPTPTHHRRQPQQPQPQQPQQQINHSMRTYQPDSSSARLMKKMGGCGEGGDKDRERVDGGFVCGRCEGFGGGVQCLGCGGVRYCQGCFWGLHHVGKFRGHLTRQITTQNHNQPNPTTPHKQNQNPHPSPSSPYSPYSPYSPCSPCSHLQQQTLQNELTSLHLKHQTSKTTMSQHISKLHTKWAQFQQMVKDELGRVKDMIEEIERDFGRRVKLEIEELGEIGDMGDMELREIGEIGDMGFIEEFMRGKKKGSQMEMLAQIRNWSQNNQCHSQSNKILRKKYELEQKISKTMKLNLLQLKKTISNLNTESIFPKSKNESQILDLTQSKLSISSQLHCNKPKKYQNSPKLPDFTKDLTRIPLHPMKKNTQISLDDSFSPLTLQQHHRPHKPNLQKVKSETTLPYYLTTNCQIPKISKHRRMVSGLVQPMK